MIATITPETCPDLRLPKVRVTAVSMNPRLEEVLAKDDRVRGHFKELVGKSIISAIPDSAGMICGALKLVLDEESHEEVEVAWALNQ